MPDAAAVGWQPPPYPYDRLSEVAEVAAAHPGGAVDLSVGTPTDAPPPAVVTALCSSGRERGYPASIGSPSYRQAAAGWMARRLGVEIDPAAVAACIGTKELVAGVPQWLRLRRPDRDTVLYPAVSYPTYAMGATLAGLPGRAGARSTNGWPSTWAPSTRPTRLGPCACGSTPPATPPGGWTIWPRWPAGAGPTTCGC